MEDEIWVASLDEWAAIELDRIDELVNTMPPHIEAVIETGGGYTKWHILVDSHLLPPLSSAKTYLI